MGLRERFEELKDKIHSPMDIAISYAKYCEAQGKYQKR